jgi:hypothetical protein
MHTPTHTYTRTREIQEWELSEIFCKLRGNLYCVWKPLHWIKFLNWYFYRSFTMFLPYDNLSFFLQ